MTTTNLKKTDAIGEKVERPWGYYKVLHEVAGCKVKELTVNPGCSLSVQRHQHRSEYWMVTEGWCEVYSYHHINCEYLVSQHGVHDSLKIKKDTWHQLRNPFDEPCRIVEIQYGSHCEEDDIERRDSPQ